MPTDKRKHARIELPFQVEISHVSIGHVRTTASNSSAGGIFVELDNPATTPGSTVHLTILNMPLIESPPTPSIKMTVSHCSGNGLGLAFSSNTSKHLWESAGRERNSLAVGEDYFQVYQNALIMNPDNQVLLVRQTGKWLLPGGYLKVGQNWEVALQHTLAKDLGLGPLSHEQFMGADAYPDIAAREAAVFTVFHLFKSNSSHVELSADCRYSDHKWMGHVRAINECTFSHPLLRTFTLKALAGQNQEHSEPVPG